MVEGERDGEVKTGRGPDGRKTTKAIPEIEFERKLFTAASETNGANVMEVREPSLYVVLITSSQINEVKRRPYYHNEAK